MTKRRVLILTLTAIAFLGIVTVVKFHSIENFLERFTQDKDEDEDGDAAAVGEMHMLWQSRAYPNPSDMEQKYMLAWDRAKQMRLEALDIRQEAGINGTSGTQTYTGNWTSIGPNTGIGGRILAIAINPARGNSIYIGSASGGIWKTYNAQAATPTWQSVTTGFPVLGVSSIIINPTDTNTIYAGTGEIYRIDSTNTTANPSTTGYNTWKTRGTYGVGILKSSDGGKTWSQVLMKSENSLFGIQKLRFDPTNSNIIYAAATDGVYVSVNSGSTWTKILAKTYVTDVVIDANNSQEIVAAVGNLDNSDKGIYRSANGGTSWTKITSGLPASIEGSIKFDNVPSAGNRDTIWASIGVAETGNPDELYFSKNFGTTWTVQPSSNHTSYQFWYSHLVTINPSNTKSLLYAGVNLFAYSQGATTPNSSVSIGHSDIHDIRFDPSNSNFVYLACDGGMYKSTNGGTSFSAINNGLGAVQFYSTVGVAKSAASAALVVGGLQDNGVIIYNGSSWTGFPNLSGTDGAACFIDPNNDNNILASGDAASTYYSTNAGGTSASKLGYWGEYADSRTAFVAPLAIGKTKIGANTIMYVGTDNLHVSTNSGTSFSNNFNPQVSPHTQANAATNYIDAIHKTAIALAISPTNSNKVYVSTSPFAQFDNDIDSLFYNPPSNVQRTLTGNTPFTKINGTTNPLPSRYIMHFAISPTNDDSVWVAVGGFGTGHIYVTPDGGTNWFNKGSGLPDVPANSVMIDPGNSNIIYAGTDIGVYVSPDRGTTWQDFNNGFWDGTLVMDLEPYPGNKILAATHGKGAFISPLYSVSLPVTLTSFTGYNNNNGYDVLQWSTSIESNLKEYDLERSTDGTNFSQITSLPAKNIDNSNYAYNDNISGLQNTPTVFYRLKIVNADGTFAYSNVVLISLNPQPGIAIAGNPFNDQFTIIFTTLASQHADMRLLDASGRALIRRSYTTQIGTNNIVVQNLGSLAKGVYLMEFITPGQRFIRKVVKK